LGLQPLFGGGTIANALVGNSVSSTANLGLALTGNHPLSPNLPPGVPGIGLGLPINEVLRLSGQPTNFIFSSPSGMVRSTGISTLFNASVDSGQISSIAAEGGEIAVQGGLTAGEFASGLGLAKFGHDTLTFAYGYFGACSQ
jgi:hypothetical protein